MGTGEQRIRSHSSSKVILIVAYFELLTVCQALSITTQWHGWGAATLQTKVAGENTDPHLTGARAHTLGPSLQLRSSVRGFCTLMRVSFISRALQFVKLVCVSLLLPSPRTRVSSTDALRLSNSDRFEVRNEWHQTLNPVLMRPVKYATFFSKAFLKRKATLWPWCARPIWDGSIHLLLLHLWTPRFCNPGSSHNGGNFHQGSFVPPTRGQLCL
jgi:hypothetical protein